MKRTLLALGVLAAVLCGCGGGGSPSPQPTWMPTVTPSPTPTVQVTFAPVPPASPVPPTASPTPTPQATSLALQTAIPPPIPDLFAPGERAVGAQRITRRTVSANVRGHGPKPPLRRGRLSLGAAVTENGHGQSGFDTSMTLDFIRSGSYALIYVDPTLQLPCAPDAGAINLLAAPTVHPINSALESSMQYLVGSCPATTTHVLRQFNLDDSVGYGTPGVKLLDFDNDPTAWQKYVRDYGHGVAELAISVQYKKDVGSISVVWNASANVWDRLASYPIGQCTPGVGCGGGWAGDEYWWDNSPCSPLATVRLDGGKELDGPDVAHMAWLDMGVQQPGGPIPIYPPSGACVTHLQFTYAPGTWIAVTP